MPRVRNWGGTVRFRPASLERPRDLDELQGVIRRAAAQGKRVRVMGAGHSWSPLVQTDGVLVDLRHFQHRTVDERGMATVGAGVRLSALNDFLDERQRALPNLGFITAQTAVGAVLTGTHGSGPAAMLASQVERLSLVTAEGAIRHIGPADSELYDAARISLGALGVVTEMQFRTRPAFNLAEERQQLPFDEAFGPAMLTRLSEDSYQHYLWMPFTDFAIHVRRDVTTHPADRPPRSGPPRSSPREFLLTRGGTWLGRALPRLVPSLNRLGDDLGMMQPGRRIGRSHQVLCGPMPPIYHETEYALPLERGPQAMLAFRRIIEAERPALNFPVLVRFAAADPLWLSPALGRPTVFVNVLASPGAGFDHGRRLLEPVCKGLGGRPHWAKRFTANPAELAELYPDTHARFGTLATRMDPRGMFRNAFLDSLFPR